MPLKYATKGFAKREWNSEYLRAILINSRAKREDFFVEFLRVNRNISVVFSRDARKFSDQSVSILSGNWLPLGLPPILGGSTSKFENFGSP